MKVKLILGPVLGFLSKYGEIKIWKSDCLKSESMQEDISPKLSEVYVALIACFEAKWASFMKNEPNKLLYKTNRT